MDMSSFCLGTDGLEGKNVDLCPENAIVVRDVQGVLKCAKCVQGC